MAQSYDSSNSNEIEIINDPVGTAVDKETSCNDIVVYKESNPILDISILNTNFDLSVMPANYMRRRSKIEEIIYRAIYSQNCSKSPFSSFRTARDVLDDFNKINIVTGINSLKKVIKSAYNANEQISIIAHKIGGTWLLDEFDMDKVMLRNHHFTEWTWLSDFIKRQRFQLVRPNVRRSTIESQDLFAKFLYHTVNHAHLALPSIEQDNNRPTSPIRSLHLSPIKNEESHSNFQLPETEQYKEDYLNVVDWKLEDLSFVVGSDLSIFGTKKHPCISLRLSPTQEPISVLTGIDIWLENLLNEVPEVAMCYHNEGIVMREYEILQTRDIPNLVGFDQSEVQSIAKNLAQFLGTNATKEGHTYWLFKEADSPMVKLYDLTTIYTKEASLNSADTNPFILPVAILCYRLAEQRIKQWHKARKSNITPTEFNEQLVNTNLADNQFYFNEIFRLLKNCINLLLRINRHHDLIHLARLSMCCLYLEMDQNTLNTLQEQPEQLRPPKDEFSFNLTDLKSPLATSPATPTNSDLTNDAQPSGETSNSREDDDTGLNGTYLYELCVNKKTDDIIDYVFNLMGTEEQPELSSVPPKELIVRNTLLTKYERQKLDSGLLESFRVYYRRKYNQTKSLKSNFILLLLNRQLCAFDNDVADISGDTVSLKLSLMKNLICLNTGELSPVSDDDTNITPVDRRVIELFQPDRSLEILTMLECVILNEPQRVEAYKHNGNLLAAWYRLVLSLIETGLRLKKSKMTKTDRTVLHKSIPVFINYLVASVVTLYQKKCLEVKDLSDNEKKSILTNWCSQMVLPNLSLIQSYNNTKLSTNSMSSLSSISNQIMEPSLLVMNWSNQARLCRLASIVDSDNSTKYLYEAADSYTHAIDCAKLIGGGGGSQNDLQLRHDRLNVCILILENSYGGVVVSNNDSIRELKKSLDCGIKLLQIESTNCFSDENWKLKVTGLRLRINNVKYFLNCNTGKHFKYQQILDEMTSDFESIMKYRADTMLRVQEAILILIYITRIQADKADILAVNILRKYLLEDCHLFQQLFSTNHRLDQDYFRGNIVKPKLIEIYKSFYYILNLFLLKSKDSSTKKNTKKQKQKQQINSDRIVELANEISGKYENLDFNQSDLNIDETLLEMSCVILQVIG